MSAFLSHVLGTVLDSLIKVTLVLLAAAPACLLLRRSSAATRHLVRNHPTLPEGLPPISAPAVPAQSAPMPTQSHPLFTAVHWAEIAIAVWFVGAVLVFGQFAVGLRRINRIRKAALPLDASTLAIAEAARQQLGIRSVEFIRASEGSSIAIPVTWGVLHPIVLLPSQSSKWSEDCLRAALLHELAHVSRRDWPTQIMTRIACALYWWHPLVWWAARQARAESERACDDLVLGTGMKATDYAQRLVEVVRSLPAGVRSHTVAIAMAQPLEVEARIAAVLAMGLDRTPRSRKRITTVMLALIVLTPTLAALRLTVVARASGNSPVRVIDLTTTEADAMVPQETLGPIIVAVGNRVVLPNGFKLALIGLTQATRAGDEWDMYGGPWWSPDGTPITPQNGWQNGHDHWSVIASHNLPPYTFKLIVQAGKTSGDQFDYSFYQQLVGALKPARYYSTVTHTSGSRTTAEPTVGPLIDGSTPDRFPEAVSVCFDQGLYQTGTRTCVVRCGIAAGPWQTIAVRPFVLTPPAVTADVSQSTRYLTDVSLSLDSPPREMYLDAHGQARVVYFLGETGRLPNVARRFVAVDAKGHVIPLNESPSSFSPGIGLAFSKASNVTQWNPKVDLSQVREFRLQTRPFQTVEFRNVQLQPTLLTGNAQDLTATMLERNAAQQVDQAKQLRSHLQGWAQAHKSLLQQMARAQPDDLASAIRVCASWERAPLPLWDADPRLGRDGDEPILQDELPSSLTLTHLQRSHDSLETQIRADFARHRDFVAAQAFSGGHVSVTVWASGRITRTASADQATGNVGGPILGGQQEIAGPFFAP